MDRGSLEGSGGVLRAIQGRPPMKNPVTAPFGGLCMPIATALEGNAMQISVLQLDRLID